MKQIFLLLLTAHCSLLTLFPQEKRLALVIGNGDYQYGGELANPVNDANSMEQVLKAVGFDVIKYENLDQKMMRQAIDNFGNLLKNYDIGLFFYAGHGVQAKGFNYLIPVDAILASEEDVEYNCVRADRVLGKMEAAANKTNIVILDACRNNPFERSWTRTPTGKGLAFMNAPTGSLIAYATSPGNTASDGSGSNGLYTSALLTYIVEPNITVLEMFQKVRTLVREKSLGDQVPWESTSLEGNFYLNTGDSIMTGITGQRINPETALNSIWEAEKGTFIDDRDMQEYNWVRIGEQIWMAEDLNFKTSTGSWCYDDFNENCEEFGRLYEWKVALTACPSGWHLPSDDEWKSLESYLGMREKDVKKQGFRGEVGGKIKEPGNLHWRTPNLVDSIQVGFNAVAGGYRDKGGKFKDLGAAGLFWSATPTDLTQPMISTSKYAWGRMLHHNYVRINRHNGNMKSEGLSVRCIKDH